MAARDLTLAQLYDLKGKVAVVTGAAKGIGQGIANRLAEAGATVLLVDVDADGAQASASAIEERGGTASSAVADLSTVDGANAAVATAIERYGRIDVLVNNAGIYPMMPALQLSEEVWDRTLNLNLKGVFFASQAGRPAPWSPPPAGRSSTSPRSTRSSRSATCPTTMRRRAAW